LNPIGIEDEMLNTLIPIVAILFCMPVVGAGIAKVWLRYATGATSNP
jgi:hypothetical protein